MAYFHSHQHMLLSSQPGLPERAKDVYLSDLSCCASPLPPPLTPIPIFCLLKASLQGLAHVACFSWNYPENVFCARIFIAPWYYYFFCTWNPIQNVGYRCQIIWIAKVERMRMYPCFVFLLCLVCALSWPQGMWRSITETSNSKWLPKALSTTGGPPELSITPKLAHWIMQDQLCMLICLFYSHYAIMSPGINELLSFLNWSRPSKTYCWDTISRHSWSNMYWPLNRE